MVPRTRGRGSCPEVMGIGGKDGLIDVPEPHRGLVGLFLQAGLHPALGASGEVAGPGAEGVVGLAGCAIGRIGHASRVEDSGDGLIP